MKHEQDDWRCTRCGGPVADYYERNLPLRPLVCLLCLDRHEQEYRGAKDELERGES